MNPLPPRPARPTGFRQGNAGADHDRTAMAACRWCRWARCSARKSRLVRLWAWKPRVTWTTANWCPTRIAVATVDGWLERQDARTPSFSTVSRAPIGQAEALPEPAGPARQPAGRPCCGWNWTTPASPNACQPAADLRGLRRDVPAWLARAESAGKHVPVCGGRLTVRGDDDPAALSRPDDALYRERTEPVADVTTTRRACCTASTRAARRRRGFRADRGGVTGKAEGGRRKAEVADPAPAEVASV